MSNPRKLYQRYINILDSFEKLHAVWYTSYTFDFEFFERYILPPVFGLRPAENLRDLAALQEKLVEQLDPVGGGESSEGETPQIDIRVFADYGGIDWSANKYTSFPIHPVTVPHGVFHPKVILLVGTKKDDETRQSAHLITGSANLTVSGWGRNLEAVADFPVEGEQNKQELLSFFEYVFRAGKVSLDSVKGFIADWESIRDDEHWSFHHSYMNQSIVDRLAAEALEPHAKLQVFSPYFSADSQTILQALIEDSQLQPGNCSLYVGRDGQRYNLTSEQVASLRSSEITLLYNADIEENVPIEHLKVWSIGNITAIGSWNCTSAAMKQNIEAGVVVRQPLQHNSNYSELDESRNLLETPEEQSELLESGQHDYVPMQVFFDWATEEYSISIAPDSPWTNSDTVFSFALPGELERVEFKPSQKKQITHELTGDASTIVKNRSYTVEWIRPGGDRIEQNGVVLERNIRMSPLYEYETLDDLLLSFAVERPRRDTQRSILEKTTQASSQDNVDFYAPKNNSIDATYFTMYSAIYRMRQRWGLEQQESVAISDEELLRMLNRSPGNLSEFQKKIAEQANPEPPNSDIPAEHRAYIWCLIQEVDVLLADLRQKYTNKGELAKKLAELQRRNHDVQCDFELTYLQGEPLKQLRQFYQDASKLKG